MLKDGKFEMNVGEDMTVPDQSYSIRDLLVKFTHGERVVLPTDGFDYDEAPDIDNPDPMNAQFLDLTDAPSRGEIEAIKDEQAKRAKTKKRTNEPTDVEHPSGHPTAEPSGKEVEERPKGES